MQVECTRNQTAVVKFIRGDGGKRALRSLSRKGGKGRKSLNSHQKKRLWDREWQISQRDRGDRA